MRELISNRKWNGVVRELQIIFVFGAQNKKRDYREVRLGCKQGQIIRIFNKINEIAFLKIVVSISERKGE